ncbi:MAG: fumarate hydratase [Clostridiales bacterium]|nr:fumarate hydratase [Clostridiales bacterium]
MKTLDANSIIIPLSQKIKHALCHVDERVLAALRQAQAAETKPLCAWALGQIVENDEIAARDESYACQDCGQAVLFVQVGQDVHIRGNLTAALNAAVEKGYETARKSVADPLTRLNTHTNTPAIIHYELVQGDKLTVHYLAKGAGSENMSRVYMLTPSKGEQGIIDAAVDCVTRAGSSPCPPIILGVGIGGTMEVCALLSKLALIGGETQRADEKALQEKILAAVNATGIGAQGFGGDITALAVHVKTAPTHIGMLPVGITVQCHSDRKCTAVF